MSEDSFNCSVEIIDGVTDDVRNFLFKTGFDYDRYDLIDNIDR